MTGNPVVGAFKLTIPQFFAVSPGFPLLRNPSRLLNSAPPKEQLHTVNFVSRILGPPVALATLPEQRVTSPWPCLVETCAHTAP